MKTLPLVVLLLFLTACAKEAKKDASIEQPLFKTWVNSGGHTYDMAGSHFGKNPVSYNINGKTCSCMLAVAGFEELGTLDIQECGFNHMADPDCDAIQVEHTYTYTSGALHVCDLANNCAWYY